jgi:hypothetical protein
VQSGRPDRARESAGRLERMMRWLRGAVIAVCIVGAGASAHAGPGAHGQASELKTDRWDLRLNLRADRSRPEASVAALPRDDRGWRDSVAVSGDLGSSDLWSLSVRSNLVDLRRAADEKAGEFDVGPLLGWEENTVSDTRIKLGFWNDRIRLTSRHGWSRYSDPSTRLDGLVIREQGGRRLATAASPPDERQGHAFSHRLSADLWKGEHLRLSTFGDFARVDRGFKAVEASEKENEKDLFRRSNEQRLGVGGVVGLGPLDLTLSRRFVTSGWDDPDGETGPRLVQNSAEVELWLDGLRDLTGAWSDRGILRLAPSSLWASVAEGQVEPGGSGEPRTDATSDLNVGMSWERGDASVSLNYWRSFYDSRQPGAEGADWAGSGTDLSFGIYRERWDLSASFGLARYDNLDEYTRSIDRSYDGSLAFAVRPEELPDLSGSVTFNRYASDYLAYGVVSATDSWSAEASLDFSKYIDAVQGETEPSLRLLYAFEGAYTRDGWTGASEQADHTVLLVVRKRF